MLHEVTEDGGLGFCHPVLPGLLPPGYHGPLVVALDSNVLIDLQQHGAALINDGPLPDRVAADGVYADELASLADLLNLWLLRDVRFVVTPRSKTDAKVVTERFLERRLPSINALADSLAFQVGNWTVPAPSHGPSPTPIGEVTGLPGGADRDLVLEAQAVGAHVFLTRDRLVLERTELAGPPMALLPPQGLAAELLAAGVQPLLGGTCDGDGCPYRGWRLPAPDMGKWSGLLSALEQNCRGGSGRMVMVDSIRCGGGRLEQQPCQTADSGSRRQAVHADRTGQPHLQERDRPTADGIQWTTWWDVDTDDVPNTVHPDEWAALAGASLADLAKLLSGARKD